MDCDKCPIKDECSKRLQELSLLARFLNSIRVEGEASFIDPLEDDKKYWCPLLHCMRRQTERIEETWLEEAPNLIKRKIGHEMHKMQE